MMTARVSLVSMLAFCASADAGLYRSVDAIGHVIYTNLPPEAAAETSGDKAAPTGLLDRKYLALPVRPPRVNPEDQRGRDQEREQILERELAKEVEALSDSAARGRTEESQRHQANLDALRRELARLHSKPSR